MGQDIVHAPANPTNGSGHVVESGTVGQQVRLYYHQDLRGTVDYLTSPVSQKVESWTHYNEWGEITHNAVLKCGQRANGVRPRIFRAGVGRRFR